MEYRLCLLFISCSAMMMSISEGALQKVCPGKPADIVFAIDESSSIWPVHFLTLRKFIANLTDSFDIGPDQTRIAAITYSDTVTHRFSLDDYKTNEDVRRAISRIDQKTGGTRTDLALKHIRHKIFSESKEGVPQIVVLITDGDSWYPEKTIHQAKLLKNRNVTIFTVAISKKIKWEEVEMVSSQPTESHIFSVDSFNDLGVTLVERLVLSTCKVQGNPVGECNINFKSDVVFVLGSASQNPGGALKAVGMIEEIIADKNTFVGDASLRFGMVPRQCSLDLGFHLNSYDNKNDIIDHLRRRKQLSTTADHINYLVTDSFEYRNGDRPEVRNLAVLIMDRESDDMAETLAAADLAKEAGIEIIVVAVGKQVNDNEISMLASQPISDYKITLSDYTEVADFKHKVYSLICP
ncbi:cartilage matrix protein-like [Watersipora subatra]|uniref:cartilage matrix protein-like n=1 Tax=Watersipora subatra TaxID=2589382 RepID=UPI00355AF0BF